MSTNRDFYVGLGAKVAEARVMRGMTQQQLADALRMTRPSITNLEAGRQRILAHTLVDLSNALAMPSRVAHMDLSNKLGWTNG